MAREGAAKDRQVSALVRLTTARLKRAAKAKPLLVFQPSPGLRAFFHDTHKRQLVLAANRVGKTWTAIAKLARRMIEADRRGSPIRVRVCGPTDKVLVGTHERYLHELLGDQLAEGSSWNAATGFNNHGKALTRGGSTCEFVTYKQDPETLESSSLHIVLLDEPPPRAHFDACVARVFDTDGEVWVTLTAVNRPVKWLRELVEQGVKDRNAGRARGWSFYQVPLSKEACPWYTRVQIEERLKEARLQPWSYRQRIEAAWEGTSDDRWYVGFSAPSHQLALGPRQGWPTGETVHLVLSVDHGEGAGHSHWTVLAYQEVARDLYGCRLNIRAIAEWTNPRRLSVESEARAVKELLEGLGFSLNQVSWGVGDHNVASKSETARTLNEAFEAEFARLMGLVPEHAKLRIKRATKGAGSVEGQVARINSLFASGELWTSDDCELVNESLSHWAGKDDGLKHAADSFRYGVIKILEETSYEPARLAA